MEWEVYLTDDVDQWLKRLADSHKESYALVVPGIEVLAEVGPNLGRPLVARIKSGDWSNWYRRAIPQAESTNHEYLRERALEEGEQ